MRIKLISDIHAEFHADNGKDFCKRLPVDNAEILIICGDLGQSQSVDICLSILSKKFPHIIYVLGNHEYYGLSLFAGKTKYTNICNSFKNVYLLDNSFITIEEQRFFGGTMWFPKVDLIDFYKKYISDSKLIKDFGNVFVENQKFIEAFEKTNANDIIVTHHLPSYNCVGKQWKHSKLNMFFVCDMEKYIIDKKPKLWCAGHTHVSCDTLVDGTRIVVNCHGGYDYNENYKENFIIKV
ncbi:metallophosphoesterase [Candidatus Pacearchaeota archaeon]|nr:metallophosphoesterase [Candidatus Pacearchaeota archaeon]